MRLLPTVLKWLLTFSLRLAAPVAADLANAIVTTLGVALQRSAPHADAKSALRRNHVF